MSDEKSRYLDYLPSIFQDDPFLGRFLLPFQEVMDAFGDLLSGIDHLWSPALTDPEFLPWLASWVALVMDEEWDEAKRRQLIGEAVELYRWRGTVKGLKRYLEIYTGLVPDIREWRWPGGMQIGVQSMVGGWSPPPGASERIRRILHVEHQEVERDYYVVDTLEEDGGRLRRVLKYHRVDRIKRVRVGTEDGEKFVRMEAVGGGEYFYVPATVTRRDGLAENTYSLGVEVETGAGTDTRDLAYAGDTVLVDEESGLPYCFIVDVKVPASEVGRIPIDRVRAIVDLEKPAHTRYYLKVTPVVSEYVLQPMQVGVRSTIGVDTTLG